MSKMEQMQSRWEIWLGDREGSSEADPMLAALDVVLGPEPTAKATHQAIVRSKAALAAALPTPIYYDVLPDTPVGSVFVSVGPAGLRDVTIGGSEVGFLSHLRAQGQAAPIRSARETHQVTFQIEQYFRGERAAFDCPVDLSGVTGFHRQVLLAAARIPRGSVTTYGALARSLGKPRAARAVGRALATNPVPLVIPCHRVIASDGSLGGYSASNGVATKLQLLRFEGAALPG